MRLNCSLYVDAGYLLASAATRVTGTSLRNGIHVEYGKLINQLTSQAQTISGMPVLRTHWYDSAKNGIPDPQQERIGELSKVKLRLGRFGVDGQQKGVDLRIGLDLVTHARNGASSVFFLVSGDDDLTEAVEEAQVHGVEVVVLAVPNADGKPQGVSRHLVRAADDVAVVDPDAVDAAVLRIETRTPAPPVELRPAEARRPAPGPALGATPGSIPTPVEVAGRARPAAPAALSPTPAPAAVLAYSGTTGSPSQVTPGYDDSPEHDEQIDRVVRQVLASFRRGASPQDVEAFILGRPSIPRDIDRALLTDVSEALGIDDLPDPIRFRLRNRFWVVFEETS